MNVNATCSYTLSEAPKSCTLFNDNKGFLFYPSRFRFILFYSIFSPGTFWDICGYSQLRLSEKPQLMWKYWNPVVGGRHFTGHKIEMHCGRCSVLSMYALKLCWLKMMWRTGFGLCALEFDTCGLDCWLCISAALQLRFVVESCFDDGLEILVK